MPSTWPLASHLVHSRCKLIYHSTAFLRAITRLCLQLVCSRENSLLEELQLCACDQNLKISSLDVPYVSQILLCKALKKGLAEVQEFQVRNCLFLHC